LQKNILSDWLQPTFFNCMIPDPNYMYQCLSCKHFQYKESAAYGNTNELISMADLQRYIDILKNSLN
jgi:hypothetical protein